MSDVSNATAVAAATETIGGACVPLTKALTRLGWPFLSRSSIHARRVAGTLPVMPRRLGGRWVVYAVDAAPLFAREQPKAGTLIAVPAHRGHGRPRKRSRGTELESVPGFTAPATDRELVHSGSMVGGNQS
jgi:hypothetical protein